MTPGLGTTACGTSSQSHSPYSASPETLHTGLPSARRPQCTSQVAPDPPEKPCKIDVADASVPVVRTPPLRSGEEGSSLPELGNFFLGSSAGQGQHPRQVCGDACIDSSCTLDESGTVGGCRPCFSESSATNKNQPSKAGNAHGHQTFHAEMEPHGGCQFVPGTSRGCSRHFDWVGSVCESGRSVPTDQAARRTDDGGCTGFVDRLGSSDKGRGAAHVESGSLHPIAFPSASSGPQVIDSPLEKRVASVPCSGGERYCTRANEKDARIRDDDGAFIAQRGNDPSCRRGCAAQHHPETFKAHTGGRCEAIHLGGFGREQAAPCFSAAHKPNTSGLHSVPGVTAAVIYDEATAVRQLSSLLQRSSFFLPGRRGKRTEPAVDDGVSMIHAPRLCPLSRQAVVEALKPELQVRFCNLFRWLKEPPSTPPGYKPRTPVMGFSPRVITSFLEADLIVPIPSPENPPECHVFLVEEWKPDGAGDLFKRYRPIFWTRSFNAAVQKVYESNLPLMLTTGQLGRWGVGCTASTRDLKGAFYQVHLEPAERACFAFYVDNTYLPVSFHLPGQQGRWFAPVSLPMGATLSPELVHMCTGALSGSPVFCSAQFVCPLLASLPPNPLLISSEKQPAVIDIYIDNLRVCAREGVARVVAAWWERRAEQLQITLKKEEAVTAATEHDHLGVHLDFSQGPHASFIEVGLKTRKHLEKTLEALKTRDLEARELEACCGRILFAARALLWSLSTLPDFILFSRALSMALNKGVLSLSDTLPLGDYRHRLIEIIEDAVKPSLLPSPGATISDSFLLIVDASLFGWGAVAVFADGQVCGFGRVFDHKEKQLIATANMVGAEVLALRNALTNLRLRASRSSFQALIFMDAMTVLAALKKGHFKVGASPQHHVSLNNVLTGCFQLLAEFSAWSANHVTSQMNAADPLSRQQSFDLVMTRLRSWDRTEKFLRSFIK